jgi:glycosyltransferase involved in cell wall biosynthesis
MKILSLSLDPLVLDPQSVAAERNRRYGDALSRYAIIVPSGEKKTVPLSEKTIVYGTGGSKKILQILQLFLYARRLLRSGHFDLITSQDTYFLGLTGLILSRMYGCALEVQVLGIEKLSPLRKMLARFVLSRADGIRVLSRGLQQRLVEGFGISTDRMSLVPIYVDVSSLGFSRAADDPEVAAVVADFEKSYGDRFNIASVNRLVPIKNIPMQLYAIAALKEAFPQILLHIVGDGPEREALAAEIERLGLQGHVILQGFKSGLALRPFFSESDCFVLTSDFEGYGMVVVEAATAGTPIVMTEVGCAGELIQDGESGRIVPPRDTEAFTDALRQVISDDGFRKHLSEGAKKAIAELPTFDTVLEKYLAAWRFAIDNHSKS